jgi:hypothetical protein
MSAEQFFSRYSNLNLNQIGGFKGNSCFPGSSTQTVLQEGGIDLSNSGMDAFSGPVTLLDPEHSLDYSASAE